MFRKLLEIPLELIIPIFKMKKKKSGKCEFGYILIHKSGSYLILGNFQGTKLIY